MTDIFFPFILLTAAHEKLSAFKRRILILLLKLGFKNLQEILNVFSKKLEH